MITHTFDFVAKIFPDARQETDGSLSFECPVCRDDNHPNKPVKLFANGALSCVRFVNAGTDDHRMHVTPIRAMLGSAEPSLGFLTESLLDGTLTLEIVPAERGKVRMLARNCVSVLHRDVLTLDKAEDRAKFVKQLALDDTSARTVHQAMLAMADRYDSVAAAIADEEEVGEPRQAIFAALPDGRLCEQIAGGMYAVYDAKKGEVTYQRKVQSDEGEHRPLQDDFLLQGGLFLPERLQEYESEVVLDAEIAAVINRYCDVPLRERMLSAKYVRLSYIADKLNEIPYFRATGERGSGKSRYIGTVGMLCLRPVLVTSPSAASLYRMMQAYQPTLVIDEFNAAAGSEDTEALMQILNCGFQRITAIPRCEKGADGQITIKMFSAFGPKLLGGLKLTESSAFESRCVSVQLQKTTRTDISFRLTKSMLRDFADLRAKLYLWRLRNWHTDFEQTLDEAERELKKFKIEPRFVQIAIPVYGLIGDAKLKEDFARMLESRTDDDASDKLDSFEGLLIRTLHRLLFEVADDDTVEWKDFGNVPRPEEGKPVELLTVAQITDTINSDLPEKKKHDAKWISRELGKLGFKRREITRRESVHRKKSAVVFGRDTFQKAFGSYALPVPQDFIPAIPATDLNPISKYEMRWPGHSEKPGPDEAYPGQRISLQDKGLPELAGIAGIEIQKVAETIPEDPYPSQLTAYPGQAESPLLFVALDTETEPFDEKRGITPRIAKMIGLALSYDGAVKTSYHTDPEAWQFLLPEPDQTVVFHNAKFDLGVLTRTGLACPPKWEDTFIASHLLNETGEHGLKPLAKAHLDVEDPITFEDADRMRLLDPEVFHEYARNDARYTFRLWPQFRREMERQGLLAVYELEKAIVPAVLNMEASGLKLDLSKMGEMAAVVKTETERLCSETFEHTGCQFDLHSPDKVAAILFDKLGVPSRKETKGGKRSVDREALEEVRGYHPAVDSLLRYREIDKLASTFLNVLPKFADNHERIHPEFRPLGATSGRFSCSNPNVQQIPARSELGKKLRQMFIADEGNALVVADWSQMELRILAQYSKDPLLLEAYSGAQETDLHTLTAARMFNKAEAAVTKPERGIAKMINFGIAYGITPIGLFNRLKPSGAEVTQADCERFIADYFKTYAGVKKFLAQVEQRTRERGYVKNWFGRRRRVSGRTPREIRQAQNFVIQSTAADMAKTALVRLQQALPEGARLIAMVHDEFIVECRREQAEDVRGLMVEAMQALPEGFTVPMPVEAKIGGNWGECK